MPRECGESLVPARQGANGTLVLDRRHQERIKSRAPRRTAAKWQRFYAGQ
jgi:hypothetical protein